jgi:hypothetical protein
MGFSDLGPHPSALSAAVGESIFRGRASRPDPMLPVHTKLAEALSLEKPSLLSPRSSAPSSVPWPTPSSPSSRWEPTG